MLHLRQSVGRQVGSLPESSGQRLPRRRCPGRSEAETILLSPHATWPCRSHRKTTQLCSTGEIVSCGFNDLSSLHNCRSCFPGLAKPKFWPKHLLL
ncbi:hypothetical protein RvY_02309 [Ramazzottius varieornatus]|uniref:Uncharacterized protein n=1 Tax=Ramazzottius varieornatus TaxID=947166 RepID=A0A1D1UMM3_RAMVA|nr:hypothetical protein RvY_02309 [Ramazzottius varieornatus]